MSQLTNIPEFNLPNNMGGAVARFLFVPIELVAYIPRIESGNIADDIQLVSGAAWFEGSGVYNGNLFDERQQPGGVNPDFFRIAFRGRIPQWNAPTAELFHNMTGHRFILLVTDQNGYTWLLGHPDYEGLEFRSDGSTGGGAASFNGHEFEFTGVMPYKAPTYQGSYLISAGTCPPATIRAIVPPGPLPGAGTAYDILTILSGGHAMLSDVMDAATPDEILYALQTVGREDDDPLRVTVTEHDGSTIMVDVGGTYTVVDFFELVVDFNAGHDTYSKPATASMAGSFNTTNITLVNCTLTSITVAGSPVSGAFSIAAGNTVVVVISQTNNALPSSVTLTGVY